MQALGELSAARVDLVRLRFPVDNAAEIWQSSCRRVDNDFYAGHMKLMWPQTGITER